jgi:hypothetical protein
MPSYHIRCFNVLKQYIESHKSTRHRYASLQELILVAKAKGVKFSSRAVHNLRNRGLISRPVVPGVYKINP